MGSWITALVHFGNKSSAFSLLFGVARQGKKKSVVPAGPFLMVDHWSLLPPPFIECKCCNCCCWEIDKKFPSFQATYERRKGEMERSVHTSGREGFHVKIPARILGWMPADWGDGTLIRSGRERGGGES